MLQNLRDEDQRTRSSTNQKKIRRKILVALETENKNENFDAYLMIPNKPVSAIATGTVLVAVFSKHLRKNVQSKLISLDDFEKLKIIGKGGFAEKVYLARKKDSG